MGFDKNKLDITLNFIKDYQTEHGKSPSFRTILKELKYSSLSAVNRYVGYLQRNGLIEKNHLGGIEIPHNIKPSKTIYAPLVGTVTCGEPIFAVENTEKTYAISSDIFGNKEIFLLKAKGESMIDAGIKDGDLLSVEKTNAVVLGEIVVAMIGDEATVKRLIKNGDDYILKAENKDFADIPVKAQDLQIVGKVVGYIHKF